MNIQQIPLESLLKSVLEQDEAAIVICNPNHIIVYMNPAADRNYIKYGGYNLLGKSIFGCHPEQANHLIRKIVEWFATDISHNKVHTFYNEKQNKDVYMIALRDDTGALIGYYEKHEFRNQDMSPFYEMSE